MVVPGFALLTFRWVITELGRFEGSWEVGLAENAGFDWSMSMALATALVSVVACFESRGLK